MNTKIIISAKTAAEFEAELLKELNKVRLITDKAAVLIGALLAAHDHKSEAGVEGFLNAGSKVFELFKNKPK